MRKAVFRGAISLDGFFAREDGSVDWLRWSDDVQEIMADMWPRFDVMVMGRKTWEHAQKQFSAKDLEKARSLKSGMKEYVLSRTLPAGEMNGYEIVNEDAGEFVRKLKTQLGKDIMVMGGGQLGSALLDAGVVDEIGFNIQPVLLGSGIPVWNRMSRQIDLELMECRALKQGCVYVTYVVKN
jgi:dihydrofolate reductase